MAGETKESVLKKYGRAIVHMRQQMEDRRFGLVVGAGASMDLGFPSWKELITRIAAHPDVAGEHLLAAGGNNTSQSQLLYEHYRARTAEKAVAADRAFNKLESMVRAGWQQVVHSALYKDVPTDTNELLKRDQYLHKFLGIVKTTPLTINYNFDDSIQRMMDATYAADENAKKRSHSTVWSANIQMFPRDGVIYHPNGYLPHQLVSERSSEQLVFLEDSFADQLIDSMAGHYTGLSYHLAQATRLLLGLSLADATLKHLLRHNALSHPGHYHYYVAYVADGIVLDAEYEKRVVDANFAVYNLITLFLRPKEIVALAELLHMPQKDFRHFAEEVGVPTTYRFLLTGSVGVGKSTMVAHFRSLRSYDEWLEPRREGMEKDPSLVDPATIKAIDEWVFRQLNLKNLAMLDATPGIHIVDRAPLDAFAFTPLAEWKEKAIHIRSAISPGVSKRTLVPAHIVLMIGDPEVMAVRALSKHKTTTATALMDQQNLLRNIYEDGIKASVVDTRDKSISQVVKEIARVVHLHPYAEMALQTWLDERADGVS